MTLFTHLNRAGLIFLSTAVLLYCTGIFAADSDTTKPIDLGKLLPVDNNKSGSIVAPGEIVSVDDFRYSTFRIRGRKIDNSNLNYYISDGLNSVSAYLGNSPVNTNTGLGDFDHINYFERYDVKQVEILQGANNTLYGNASLGGIIRYMPNKPVLGEFSSHIGLAGNRLSGSDDDLGYSGDATLNIPLADTFAFRFAGGHLKTAGSTDYRNLYKLNAVNEPVNANLPLGMPMQADFASQNDVNSFFSYGRGSLLWKPQHNIEAQLTYVYQNDKRGGNRVNTLGADGFDVDCQFNQSGALITESINFFSSVHSQFSMSLSFSDTTKLLPSYTILNAGVGFLRGSNALYLFANNITNRKGILSEETANAGPSIFQNVYSSGVAQSITVPRLVGVKFTTSF